MMQKTRPTPRVRGPNLELFLERNTHVTFENSLKLADERNLVIASNKSLGSVMTSNRVAIPGGYPCFSGTFVAHERTGNKLGNSIEFKDPKTGSRWVFPVPIEFKGARNVLLVAEHPDYFIEREGRYCIVHSSNIDIVNGFPKKSESWYLPDPVHGLPQGDPIDGSNRANRLYLVRKKGVSIGPVARGIIDGFGKYRFVEIGLPPSSNNSAIITESG